MTSSESSSMMMKSDNENDLINTGNTSVTVATTSTSTTNNSKTALNNNFYFTCTENNLNGTNKSSASQIVGATSISSQNTSSVTSTTQSLATNKDSTPTITLASFSKIKYELDPSEQMIRSSLPIVSRPTTNHSDNCVSTTIHQNSIANTNVVSAKMGSRRIFTPQFKLQVLESYRNDGDCKGNQRATARKYNIHRRQIQKWLQCEASLRSSVANISGNNVKHQFHNISHQMPIVSTSGLSSTAPSSLHTNNSTNNNNNNHANHNQQYKAINNRLSLDTTRHSVALSSMPIPTSKATQQGVLMAAAAAAAAAVAAGATTPSNIGDVVGAVAPLSPPSPSSTSFLSNTVKNLYAPTSPILQSQILTKSTIAPIVLPMQCNKNAPLMGGPGGTSTPPQPSSVLTSTQIHQTYRSDSIGIHTTPPALLTSVPVSVPIITPHPHSHLHAVNLKNRYQHLQMDPLHHHQHHHAHQHQQRNQHQLHHQHHHLQHHHHHHHHPAHLIHQEHHNHHHQQQHDLCNQVSAHSTLSSQQSSERRPLMPSASLPALPSCSPSTSSSSSPSSPSSSLSLPLSSPMSTTTSSPPVATTTAVALSCTDTSITTPVAASSLPQTEEIRISELRDYQTTATVVVEHRYMNENEYALSRPPQMHHRAFDGFHYFMPLPIHPAAAVAAMIAPIDLSLGPKRTDYTPHTAIEISAYKTDTGETSDTIEHNDDNEDSNLNVVDPDVTDSSVVDLTLRKRKVHMSTASEPETVSSEKHTKFSSANQTGETAKTEDITKPQEPPKTFKLFKPYLLDNDTDNTNGKDDNKDQEKANKICQQKDPIIWSHHAACLSPSISHDSRSNFQSPPAADGYPFPAGSPNFQSASSSTGTPASPECAKASPVSGYESSSSICSDTPSSNNSEQLYSSSTPHSTSSSYSIDLKVHNINGDIHSKHLIPVMSQRPFIPEGCILLPPVDMNHVQRWLDQESGIRQGIALYV